MAGDLRLIAGTAGPAARNTGAPAGAGDILAQLDVAAWEWDLASDRLTWSDNASSLLECDRHRIATGTGWRALVSQRSPQAREDILARAAGHDVSAKTRPFTLRYEIAVPGGLLPVEDTGKVYFGEKGRVVRAVGLIRPILPGASEALDSTAGLATAARGDLMGWIGGAFARAKAEGRSFGLIVFSVAGFSMIEDSSGSEVAEQVAHAALLRLRGQLRRTDKVVRYATNRFAAVMMRAGVDVVTASARRLVDCMESEPVTTDAGLVPVRASAGCILGPDYARDARTLLRRAEEAMEKGRRTGEAVVFYEPDRRGEAARARTQALSDNVIEALDDNRLVIARQPILAARTRKPAFEEALLRIVRKDGSVVGAGEVIPTFEHLGRIEMLDMRVLDLVIETLAAEPATSLSVNVSVATLRAGNWMKRLGEALQGRPELARRLVVEMTESQAIDDAAGAKRAFAEIRALGARTAIDDFGAGYTSFRHLRGLDVDIVKIDGGFVENVGVSRDDTFFVRTLVDLARHLGIETVAEWVRDEQAAALLTSFGVDFLQGDCLGPARILAPLPMADLPRERRGAA